MTGLQTVFDRAAFPCYLLANIFQFMVLRYSALFTLVTGLLQIIACIIWAAVRNPVPLVIPFEEGALHTRFGAHFWLTLINGERPFLTFSSHSSIVGYSDPH